MTGAATEAPKSRASVAGGDRGTHMAADREPNPFDRPNPFGRSSPWPRTSSEAMRIGPLPKARPAPPPEPAPERRVDPRTSILTGSATPLPLPTGLAIPDPPGARPADPEPIDGQPELAIPDTPGALPRSWRVAPRRRARPARLIPALAAGADGLFIETHPDPANAISDGPNMIPLPELPALLAQCVTVWKAVRSSS